MHIAVKQRFVEFLILQGQLRPEILQRASKQLCSTSETLGRIALLHNLISPDNLETLLQLEKTGKAFDSLVGEHKLLSERQLKLLRAGQKVRACIELIEQLALSGSIDVRSGIAALATFLASEHFDCDMQESAATTSR